MKFIGKDEKDKIDQLNQIFSTSYRSIPYDFKKTEDIIEATVMATAEFIDFNHYFHTLANLAELYDESVETFNPAAWMNLAREGTTNVNELDKAEKYLNKASDAFFTLSNKSLKKCKQMWHIVFFESPKEVIEHFFGEELIISKNIFEDIFKDDKYRIIDNIAYDGNIQNSAMQFAQSLKEYVIEIAKPNIRT